MRVAPCRVRVETENKNDESAGLKKINKNVTPDATAKTTVSHRLRRAVCLVECPSTSGLRWSGRAVFILFFYPFYRFYPTTGGRVRIWLRQHVRVTYNELCGVDSSLVVFTDWTKSLFVLVRVRSRLCAKHSGKNSLLIQNIITDNHENHIKSFVFSLRF